MVISAHPCQPPWPKHGDGSIGFALRGRPVRLSAGGDRCLRCSWFLGLGTIGTLVSTATASILYAPVSHSQDLATGLKSVFPER